MGLKVTPIYEIRSMPQELGSSALSPLCSVKLHSSRNFFTTNYIYNNALADAMNLLSRGAIAD